LHVVKEPGDIEAEFAKVGFKQVLKKFLTFRDPAPFFFPKTTDNFIDSYHTPIALPHWLSEEDLDYYVSNYEKTGFTGGINYYRAFKLDWELLAPWEGAKVNVPVKFVVGDLDLVYHIPLVKEYVHGGGFKKDVPLLDDEIVVMEDVAHFINQEKPQDVNYHIHNFIKRTYEAPKERNSCNLSAIQLKKWLKRGEQTFVATLVELKPEVYQDIPDKVAELMERYKDIMSPELPKVLPPKRHTDHKIELEPGALVLSKAPYRMGPSKLVELRRQLNELLDGGLIR
ncbi:bifunctional epoxide hydrolase 2-like, partial [Impatiens glandulifera]|uniref:bifunctional epoxide hydrolase 2-like n=1 Tax=Impatiens glandulifera TaxID=253017 RepID=UPI001FB09B22